MYFIQYITLHACYLIIPLVQSELYELDWGQNDDQVDASIEVKIYLKSKKKCQQLLNQF